MASREQIEIEIKLRDMMSGGLQQMSRELDSLNKKATELGYGAAGGFNKFRRENDQFFESNTRTNRSLTTTSGLLGGMSKELLGPVGVVAGFVAAGKSLVEFADSRLKLRALSTDVGFSTGMILGMRRQMYLAGKDTEETNRAIGAIGGSLKDLQAKEYGSQISQDLRNLGLGSLADELLKDVRQNKFNSAFEAIIRDWTGYGARMRALVAEKFHVSESDIDAIVGSIDKLSAAQQAAIERQALKVRGWAQLFKDAWNVVAGETVDAIDAASKRMNEKYKEAQGNVPQYGIPRRPGAPAEPDQSKPSTFWPWLKEQLLTKGETYHPMEPPKSGGWWQQFLGVLPKAAASFPPTGEAPASFDERFRATDFSGRSRLQNLVGAGLDKYQAGVDWLNASTTVPGMTDSKKSLLYKLHESIKPPDVESILDQMIPVNPLLFLKHVAQQYSRGGNDATFSDRFSAIWGDEKGGTDISARQRTDELINIEKDSSKILLDIRDILQGPGVDGELAGRGGAASRGGGGGRRSLGARIGIEGGRRGGAQNSDYTPSGEPVAGLVQDRQRFAEELKRDPGLKTELFKHMVGENNNPLAQQALIETAMNRASERRTTLRAQLAYFQGYRPYNQNQAAVLDKNLAAVLGGSNVSMGSTDNSSQGLAEREAASGKFIRRRIINGESFFIPGWAEPNWKAGYGPWADKRGIDPATGEARRTIDHAQSPTQTGRDANMSATVDFRNMPSWVKSSVDSNGVFKNLKVTRATPVNGRAGSGLSEPNIWAYE